MCSCLNVEISKFYYKDEIVLKKIFGVPTLTLQIAIRGIVDNECIQHYVSNSV